MINLRFILWCYYFLQQLAEDLTKLLHEKYYQDLLKMVVNYAEGHCDYKFLKVFDYAVNNLPNKDCMPLFVFYFSFIEYFL